MAALPIAATADSGPDDLGHRVRVLVLDDEELVRWGFRVLLTHQRWSERCLPAPDVDAAIELARRFAPHIALVDVGMLGDDPAGVCGRLASACPTMRLLLLSSADAVSLATVRAYGAAGYVCRAWSARDLLRAIRLASLGRPPGSYRPAAQSSLSPRQQEVLQLIAAGQTNAEIAKRLFLSRHTVKQHTSALYRKLRVKNRTHAVQAAQRMGLIAV
jgi:DNA-binding NarL/FixJ family response regulator